MRYRGLYRFGDRVIFSYDVNRQAILDLPGAEKINDTVAISRTLHLPANRLPMELLVAEIGTDFGNRAGDDGSPPLHGNRCQARGDLSAGLAGDVSGHVWKIDQATRLSLVLPASEKPQTVKIVLARVPAGELAEALDRLYLAGLRGWQSSAARDGTFQRVRYTGKPVQSVSAMRVTRTGIELDLESATGEPIIRQIYGTINAVP